MSGMKSPFWMACRSLAAARSGYGLRKSPATTADASMASYPRSSTGSVVVICSGPPQRSLTFVSVSECTGSLADGVDTDHAHPPHRPAHDCQHLHLLRR